MIKKSALKACESENSCKILHLLKRNISRFMNKFSNLITDPKSMRVLLSNCNNSNFATEIVFYDFVFNTLTYKRSLLIPHSLKKRFNCKIESDNHPNIFFFCFFESCQRL